MALKLTTFSLEIQSYFPIYSHCRIRSKMRNIFSTISSEDISQFSDKITIVRINGIVNIC